ncbi:MAG: hypothetical protein FWG10_09245 [Eubacteriaceae bacterium]|nr:hypothetical protein [Eubacteriaceae bacterium]
MAIASAHFAQCSLVREYIILSRPSSFAWSNIALHAPHSLEYSILNPDVGTTSLERG